MDCSIGTVSGYTKVGGAEKQFYRVDCGKLTCPRCGPKKAKKYRVAVAKHAEVMKLTRFLTLTLDPSLIPEGVDSVSHLRKCWAKFRVYLGRKYKQTSYISIVELHKSGIAHLHVLVSRHIPARWILNVWKSIHAGRILKIKLVDVHRIAAYLTKYITKELLIMVPWRKKRISTSRDIVLFLKRESTGWQWERRNIADVLNTYTEFRRAKIIFGFKFDDVGLSGFKVQGEYIVGKIDSYFA